MYQEKKQTFNNKNSDSRKTISGKSGKTKRNMKLILSENPGIFQGIPLLLMTRDISSSRDGMMM